MASHIAPALAEVATVCQIDSNSGASAAVLAQTVNALPGSAGVCESVKGLDGIMPDADFYLIAASDDAIVSIAASTPDYPGIWAHTSGSVGIDVFAAHKTRYGSFYPLQTFSKGVDVNLRQVPFFVEGSDSATAEALTDLASKISVSVRAADSALRRDLHIAAVFACNFANQLWADADTLLRRRGLDIRFLMPLIQATVDKIAEAPPAQVMTGPARRGDHKVIESHLEALPPDLQPVYRLMSERILSIYHPERQPLNKQPK